MAQTETQILPAANPEGIMRRMGRIWKWREEAAGAFWDEAQTVLKGNGVIAVPTETFYALAANPFSGRGPGPALCPQSNRARKSRCW